jgi:hypothetical protein
MEIYDDTHLQGKVSDQIFILSDTESKMSDVENKEELIISPSNSDKDILQQPAGSSETMNTTVDKGIKRSVVTNPSLVMKTIRTLHAKVEELQKDAIRARKHKSLRENYVEKRFRVQDKLINAPTLPPLSSRPSRVTPPARSSSKPPTKTAERAASLL